MDEKNKDMKKISWCWWIIIMVVLISSGVKAQDFYFSQFYASPLTLNPALGGLTPGNIRIAANYRNQNASLVPFTTYAASLEGKILKNKLVHDIMAAGIVVVRDELYNKSVNNTLLMFSWSYHNRISANDYLAAGLQGGLFQHYLNMNAFQYPEQWDPVTGSPSRPVTEQFQDMNVLLPDINLGLMWYHYLPSDASVFLGGSVFHLTQPKEKFLNTTGMIPRRYVVHGGSRFMLDKKVSLIPNAIVMRQQKATQFIMGTTLEYRTAATTAFKTGGWFRYKDVMILFMGMELKGIEVGVSYDFVVSQKYFGQNKGAIEISAIFTSAFKNKASLQNNPGLRF